MYLAKDLKQFHTHFHHLYSFYSSPDRRPCINVPSQSSETVSHPFSPSLYNFYSSPDQRPCGPFMYGVVLDVDFFGIELFFA